jgi:hypothetical protein
LGDAGLPPKKPAMGDTAVVSLLGATACVAAAFGFFGATARVAAVICFLGATARMAATFCFWGATARVAPPFRTAQVTAGGGGGVTAWLRLS